MGNLVRENGSWVEKPSSSTGSASSTGSSAPNRSTSSTGSSGSSTGGSASGSTVSSAVASNGLTYDVSSAAGKAFLTDAGAGKTMTSADGAVWTKNADGSTTIAKNGVTYSFAAPAGSAGSGGTAFAPTKADINAGGALKALQSGNTALAQGILEQAAGLDPSASYSAAAEYNRQQNAAAQETQYTQQIAALQQQLAALREEYEAAREADQLASRQAWEAWQAENAAAQEQQQEASRQRWEAWQAQLADERAAREARQEQREQTLSSMRQSLAEQYQAAQEQQRAAADYATEQGVNALTRAQEDAQEQFRAQRQQIDADEARALDNQALYSERRGDNGGVGAAQYGAIANTAAKNRFAVNQAQTKLATDTARQIEDLRAQGEYKKADAALQLTQSYLAQLHSFEQWALEFDMSYEQVQESIRKWEQEYALRLAELTGYLDGTPTAATVQQAYSRELQAANLTGYYNGYSTLSARQAAAQLDLQRQSQALEQAYREAGLTGYYNGAATAAYEKQQREQEELLAKYGVAAANLGIMPSDSQRAAMRELYGYDDTVIQDVVFQARLESAGGTGSARKLSAGGASSGGVSSGGASSGGAAGDSFVSEAVKWSPVDRYVQDGGRVENYFYSKEIAREFGYASMAEAVRAYNDFCQRRKQRYAAADSASNSTTAGNPGQLYYDPDEGIFTWNGKRYNSLEKLREAWDAAQITGTRRDALEKLLEPWKLEG